MPIYDSVSFGILLAGRQTGEDLVQRHREIGREVAHNLQHGGAVEVVREENLVDDHRTERLVMGEHHIGQPTQHPPVAVGSVDDSCREFSGVGAGNDALFDLQSIDILGDQLAMNAARQRHTFAHLVAGRCGGPPT
ncbi:hypothetical protein AB0B25_28020 [Nocardia sp. NPDC049190]|uniref:hypothetical protein n=1 Tax=Nocardia sp. NPDC049190 TaxID=3155650 RepID=UPI0033C620DF